MNIEITDLDNILNYLETTSLEPHDDYSSEFTYKEQKILYKYIKQLQQENKILKENAENNDKVVDRINWKNQLLKKENKQLKDNWNKLREWIVYNKHNENTEQHYLVVDYGTLLGKMKELEKGSDSDE
jgi:hypothetical protein